jgi:hypothetical protein
MQTNVKNVDNIKYYKGQSHFSETFIILGSRLKKITL